jgi:hypothetical protein
MDSDSDQDDKKDKEEEEEEDPKYKDLDDKGRVEVAEVLKTEGNTHFKAKELEPAYEKYAEGMKVINKLSSGAHENVNPLKLSFNLNMAAVELKRENWASARDHASKALSIDLDSSKARFRRGVARFRSGELDGAKADLLHVAKADPKNKDARKELAALKEALKAKKEAEKKAMKNMFASSMYGDKEEEAKKKKIQKAKEEKRKAEQKEKEEAALKERHEEALKKHEEGLKERYEEECKRREMVEEEPMTFEDYKMDIGDDPISFEDFKKGEEDKKKAEEEEKKKAKEAKQKEKDAAKRKAREASKKDDVVTVDDEDDDLGSIAKGYKQKSTGAKTSYFDNELSDRDKALIGNITPQKIEKSPSPKKASGEKTGQSKWNMAGTWEERDTTKWVHSKLRELLGAGASGDEDKADGRVCATTGGMEALKTDPNRMFSALQGMDAGAMGGFGAGDDPMGSMAKLMESMAEVKIKVTKVKSLEGDASFVVVRGKDRHLFDLVQ